MIDPGSIQGGGGSYDDPVEVTDDGGEESDLGFTPEPDVGSSYDEDAWEGSNDAESQEDDTVTYEDIADPEDVDSEEALDAISDDPNTDDTVDESTTVNPEDGGTYVNVGGSGDDAEWATGEDVLDSNQGSGGTNTGTTDQSENTSQSAGVEDRLGELLSGMEASSEQAAVVPVPFEGSSGLTATGAVAGIAGLGALYLAFAGGS